MVKRQRGTEAAPIEDALCDMTAEKNRRDGNSAEEDLKKWEKEVTESGVEAAKRVDDFVSVIKSAETDTRRRVRAVHALRRCFVALEPHFLKEGVEYDDDERDVGEWLDARRSDLYECLGSMVMDGDDSLARTALGVAAACGAHWKHFKAVFRELLIWAFLDREGANATRTRIMIASSFMERYDDVRLALIEIVTSICKEYHLREENDGAEARIAESALELLSHEKIPLSPSDKITLLQDVNKFAFREGATDVAGPKSYLKQQRRALGDCWLALLQMHLPDRLEDEILIRLSEEVIPKISQPIRLSDYLLSTYNRGGLSAILALDGVWLLIRNHGLDYPLFYEKLYGLLTPELFLARRRKRFMMLFPKFLASGYLPGYLVAAFVKRLLRRALLAPPQGALWCMRVTLDLIQRHPSVVPLVHKSSAEQAQESVNFFLGKQEQEEVVGAEIGQVDPFDDSVVDPMKSNADKSSLWELEALKRHYCPAVARLVTAFTKDYRQRKVRGELTLPGAIEDYASIEYSDLFEAELKRRAKECPVAYAMPTAEECNSIGFEAPLPSLRW